MTPNYIVIKYYSSLSYLCRQSAPQIKNTIYTCYIINLRLNKPRFLINAVHFFFLSKFTDKVNNSYI